MSLQGSHKSFVLDLDLDYVRLSKQHCTQKNKNQLLSHTQLVIIVA